MKKRLPFFKSSLAQVSTSVDPGNKATLFGRFDGGQLPSKFGLKQFSGS